LLEAGITISQDNILSICLKKKNLTMNQNVDFKHISLKLYVEEKRKNSLDLNFSLSFAFEIILGIEESL
jgi:hypothetical protein